MARTVTAALVDVAACWKTLGDDGVRRLAARGVKALDLRLPDSHVGPAWDALIELACAAWRRGQAVCLHSWEGKWDGAKSTADALEGYRDAVYIVRRILLLEQAARARGIPSNVAIVARYRGNLERDVWRWLNGFANPQADAYMEAMLDTLEYAKAAKWPAAHSDWIGATNRGTKLDYVGFGNPDRHYKDADQDRDGHQDDTIPKWLQPRYARVALMVYQTRWQDMLVVLEDGLKTWPANEVAVFVAVGRIDKTAGQVGNDEDLLEFLRRCPARVVEVVPYFGFGAEQQLLLGHAGFPSLEVLAPRLAA